MFYNINKNQTLDAILGRLSTIQDELSEFASKKLAEANQASEAISELQSQEVLASASAARALRIRERMEQLTS